MKKILTIPIAIIITLTYVLITSSYTEEPEVLKTEAVKDNLPQVITSVQINKRFDFAGEPLPLDNFDVFERLDRELLVNSYWHSSTILNIKRSSRYMAQIERILIEEQVPLDFKYLAVAESNLENVTSPAGAKGIWQIMKPTGVAHGLEINYEIDERFHFEKSTRAACSVIKAYKKRFGTWTLAAAAYNMGETRLAKEMKAQEQSSYYDLNLGSESSRYIFRLVALKEILKNPEKYGFQLKPEEKYKPLDDYIIVNVTSPVPSLAEVAKNNNISYRMLKVYNPWLISPKITVKPGKEYKLKIPRS
jgi:hypothetical protein